MHTPLPDADEQTKAFFSVLNRFRRLNPFTLLPLPRHDYMLLFTIRSLQDQFPGGLTVSDVAREMCVAQPAVSRTLRGLETHKLIQREISPADRRRIYVKLTPKGLHTIQQADAVLQEFHQGVKKQFMPQDLEQLIRLLHQLCQISEEQLQQMKKGVSQHHG